MLSFDSAGFCRKIMKKQTMNSSVTRVAFVSLRESRKFGVRNIKCVLIITHYCRDIQKYNCSILLTITPLL